MTYRRRLSSLWNRVDSGEIHQAPRKWQPWLSDTGSLTQKIERAIGQKLEVLVLRDFRQNLDGDESRYFHLKTTRCRIRDVLLCYNGTPLVMARSVIPTFRAIKSSPPFTSLESMTTTGEARSRGVDASRVCFFCYGSDTLPGKKNRACRSKSVV